MAIYLDHAATTPMTPEVLEAYTSALMVAGNPSSIHSQGQAVRGMLENARHTIAEAVSADTMEVTFTSGGTESINLAIKGLFWAAGEGRTRILSTRAEHHATIDSIEWLERYEGAVVEWIPVDATGRIDLDALAAALGPDVALVTTLLANNEVGTLQPVNEIVALAAAHGVPVHVDAVSALGSVPVDFRATGAAALSISAHKVGGPVGVGALVIGRGASITPLVHGGNQQRSRSGTMDAAGAHAFAVALAAAEGARRTHSGEVRALRDRLIAGVQRVVPEAILRGDPTERLPGNAHFTFPGCEGDSLLYLLDAAGFSVSTGSACQAGVPEASHVLLAMGLSETDARGALRFTLGHTTTAAEIDALIGALPDAVERARRAGMA
ncbi:cysteine desulfurase [Leifsonia sp. AK011]|uniref:cysteine desulfurase family protein n=1 Tax=Leifsonia sp. AK011 TaxID=2723075 RepID=UPI0015CDD78C|nr:cysteine desulfurase family protein [Leifsonia sp. AK011]NYF11206.1 cysteine desulfurase [Leifsonia sp. AK011]